MENKKDDTTPIDFTPLNFAILLVEDSEINQILTKTRLEKWGCIIDIANNGLEAIDKVKNNLYNIILMDIEMPVMNGYEATRIIKNDISPKASKTPILGMSGHNSKTETSKMINVGMEAFIIKPFNMEELYKTLIKYAIKQL
ncbi:response regulator [Lutibacter agarilyticus]|nr:response regulator [Lutibacter agarilyticus]